MLKLYKYIFYRIYSWNLKTWGKKDTPEWNAVIGVSFMMFINLFFLALLYEFVGNEEFIIENTPKKIIILIMLVLFGLNYY